jgi:DNA-binding FadR family transcriptional regulator
LPNDPKLPFGVLKPLRAGKRSYVAQEVLEQLGNAILKGTYPEGEKLPSERVLAEQLHVSRVLVRQAIHRLAEMGLVTVRQGAPTRVGSLRTASGIGVLDLIYRLGDQLPGAYETYVIERQFMNGISLIELAALNGTAAERSEVFRWVNDNAPENTEGFMTFERQFWLRVAEAGHNPIFATELRWWYGLVAERMPRPEGAATTPLEARVGFHRELARRLRDDDNPSAYYLEVIRPILAALRSR